MSWKKLGQTDTVQDSNLFCQLKKYAHLDLKACVSLAWSQTYSCGVLFSIAALRSWVLCNLTASDLESCSYDFSCLKSFWSKPIKILYKEELESISLFINLYYVIYLLIKKKGKWCRNFIQVELVCRNHH